MKIDLISVMEQAVEKLTQYKSKKIHLFHHNDTDGVSSGSLLLSAFQQCGYDVSRFSLEKPYPQILKKIFSSNNQIIIFADFAGKIAPMIAKMNNGKNLVIIVDHHPGEITSDSMVFNLNGDLFGLKGDRDISASATSYLFAEVLMKHFGADARLLSHLGTLGAIGDGFLVDGALAGVNREVLYDAVDAGNLKVIVGEKGEEYFITLGGEEYPALEICDSLDTLGGVGYYDVGTSLAVDLCLSGMSSVIGEQIGRMKLVKQDIFLKELKSLKTNIQTTDHLQWFNVGDRFKPMGVKMIGVFCMYVKDMDFLDDKKYLAGFQNVPDQVPGFGEVLFDSAKISMRVSQYLTDQIRSGSSPGLNSFLPDATNNIGGFVDACHSLSAATTVEKGKEKLLIEEIEKVLAKRMEVNGQR